MSNGNNSTVLPDPGQKTIFAPFVPDEEQPYIFVSYSHSDKVRVFPIIKELYEKGWRVWYDEGIPIGNGTDYMRTLASHIKNCEIMVAFVTNKSVKSKFITEKELEYGFASSDRRIVFCYLDSDAALPDSIELLAAKKDKYPRTDREGLEAALKGMEGLSRTAPREAVGYDVVVNAAAAIDAAEEGDEYDYEKCEGGIRLTNYKGSEENVIIPEVYKGQPVVELRNTFKRSDVRTVVVPDTVRKIDFCTFLGCYHLTDVYIPASVKEIYKTAFSAELDNGTHCAVHCAEGTAAYFFAADADYLTVIKDDSLNVTRTSLPDISGKFAFCSYAGDKKREAERIISRLAENGCSVLASGSLTDKEKIDSLLKAECLIAFVSKGYIKDDVSFLKLGKSMGKNYIIYALDGSALPADLDISLNTEQQLRYDSGTEDDRLKKLIKLLSGIGCAKSPSGGLKASADIPYFEYTTDTDGNIILTKYTGNDEEVVVPGSHAGHRVVELRGTFEDCTNMRSVTIPETVAVIGEEAFRNCERLTAVTIPESVVSIGEHAFLGCGGLSSVTFGSRVESIGDGAFWRCGLAEVTFPESLKSIGVSAFLGCEGLISVTIPGNVASIGAYAFASCHSLKSIEVSSDNRNYISVDGVLFSKGKKTLAAFPAGLGGKYTVPRGVTRIGDGAFYDCENLTSVILPDGLLSIGKEAFLLCYDLSSIVIPRSVEYIDEYAFGIELGASGGLTSAAILSSVTKIHEFAFTSCGDDFTLYCPENSAAWRCCEKEDVPHEPLNKSPVSITPAKKTRRFPAVLIVLLVLLAAAAGIQLSGLFDILGWLSGLLG